MRKKNASPGLPHGIRKVRTGIKGLDEITQGGLPAGRPTLVCGAAGCGKTMLGIEFVVRGATEFDEPGVIMTFEESVAELTENVTSLGFDLQKLTDDNKLRIDYVRVERHEIEETGEYDLSGLFLRLDYAIESIGAKRVLIDTPEALFSGFTNHVILRAELRRLFGWLKAKGVTAVITGERGEATLTRFGIEEYVADCVILLDHRVAGEISTRRLRVVKYRGSGHGTNEYPFLIGSHGISVLPITSLQLDHHAPDSRVSTGIPQLDEMVGGGYLEGSSVLITGSPGTGKTSLGAKFVENLCRNGKKAIIFSYEESPEQLIRNMRSIGIDLGRWVKKGLLKISSSRPSLYGLEQHLVVMHDQIVEFGPDGVVVDPISSFTTGNESEQVKPTLLRLIDFLKSRGITGIFTVLTTARSLADPLDESGVSVSSLMDSWLLLRNEEFNGERSRTFMILKSRGTNHSNQVREFTLTSDGISLVDAYVGNNRVLTGTARVVQESKEKAERELRQAEHARQLRLHEVKRKRLAAQMAVLEAEAAAEESEAEFLARADQIIELAEASDAQLMRSVRERQGGRN